MDGAATLVDGSLLQRELDALRLAQEPDGSVFAGAWRSRVQRARRVWSDCNAFVTALVSEVLEPLAHRPDVATMLGGARAFLRRCSATHSQDHCSFWSIDDPRFRASPDLDDTALVRGVLWDGSSSGDATAEALRIFAPYRATRGTPLAAPSGWARNFPGMFGTWMHDGRCVIDLTVNANVLAYLYRVNADIPGMIEAESALGTILAQDHDLEARSPYYRSRALVLWRCALALRAGARISEALRSRLRAEIAQPAQTAGQPAVWLAACAAAGIEPPAALRKAFRSSVAAGWPELRVCSDLVGRTAWSSGSLPTALAAAHLSST
jgi:hypothetical protein